MGKQRSAASSGLGSFRRRLSQWRSVLGRRREHRHLREQPVRLHRLQHLTGADFQLVPPQSDSDSVCDLTTFQTNLLRDHNSSAHSRTSCFEAIFSQTCAVTQLTLVHLPDYVERDDIRGAPDPRGGHIHHGGDGLLLRSEAEAEQSAGELPRCNVHLQSQPGEVRGGVRGEQTDADNSK